MSENPYHPPETRTEVAPPRRRLLRNLIAAILVILSIPVSVFAFTKIFAVAERVMKGNLATNADLTFIAATEGLTAIAVLVVLLVFASKLFKAK